MIPLSDQEQVMKSMVDHPAGRHRYAGPHGDDHQIGHARADRDAAPGDTGLFDALGLVLCLLGLFFLVAVAAVIGWHAAGTVGAVIGATATIFFIHFFIRSLS
ncbi:MAG: hypothetical protein L0K30_00250 [Acidipropionibacterium jensenii]|uniref:hypothetical protein n=1 Tax=Acidipropionibacterium jensenii TaxID=1749 RepID=UPI0026473472|nr:hypothetical protein [Acidipropionibacterium jensenii]MDN6440463.1 hypothetical protein [Acidipropionibacterium jensenii]